MSESSITWELTESTDTPSHHEIQDSIPHFIQVSPDFITQYIIKIGPSATCVYLYILKCAGPKSTCFPSQAKIATILGMSERTVNTAIKVLTKEGLIITKQRASKSGERSSNITTITRKYCGPPYANIAVGPYANIADKIDKDLKQIEPKGSLTPPVKSTQENTGRKGQVPEDWSPVNASYEYAIDHGMTELGVIHDQAEAFRDYHRSKGNVFANIELAWHTWCRNYQKFNAKRMNGFDTSPSGAKGWSYPDPEVTE